MSPRIRVLHFANLINRHDFIFNVVAHCDRARFDIAAATLTPRGSLNSDPGDIRVEDLGGPTRLTYPRALVRLRRLLKRDAVEVLHSHHYEPSLLAAVALVGLETRLVVGRHYSDTIYKFSRGLRRRVYLALEGFTNARAAAVVAPSTVVERILLEQGVPRLKVAKIHYGFDFARFEMPADHVLQRARQEWPTGDGLRLATVGRLHPEKGLRFLLEALALLRKEGVPVRLLLVGDGQERGPLEALAAEWGLEPFVRITGWRTDVFGLIAAADAVVQPTLNEAFSQVMVEAMALGRPLVMTDVGGVRDVVDDGVSGLVVPIRDARALATAIRALQDPGLCVRLGTNAARVIRERLDVSRIARELESLYLQVLGGRRTVADLA